eukprot:GFYU01004279.1.p1 GENE.GFYU01004279.1~~GFYU01004279.1.p1  ORF type:complete len:266 (+),score=63.66 GFYU01004279.1:131-928(+)
MSSNVGTKPTGKSGTGGDGGDGRVLREKQGNNGSVVRVVEVDIVSCRVDAIVNAANSLSFMPMDGGVSGALRNACKPASVTGLVKRWWDQKGVMQETKKVPTTQAGVQEAAGGLKERGVKYIVHAVGPIWTDYPIEEATFDSILPRIRRTVKRALNACARVEATTCALPAISGGIFTHWKPNSDIKEREQAAARVAVVEAVFRWVETNPGSCIERIDIVDLPKNKKGAVHMFVQAFDSVSSRAHAESAMPDTSTTPTQSVSAAEE